MNEAQLHRIHGAAAGFLRARPDASILSSDGFARLVQHIAEQTHEATASLPRQALRTATAMCAFGCDEAPSLAAFDHFSDVAQREIGDDPDRVKEIAIGYGCGAWRAGQPPAGAWSGDWPRAWIELAREVERPVLEVLEWLSDRVIGLPRNPYWRANPDGREIVEEHAAELATTLARPLTPLHSLCENDTFDIAHLPDGATLRWSRTLSAHVRPGARAVLEKADPDEVVLTGPQLQSQNFEGPEGAVLKVLARDDQTRVMPPAPQREIRLLEDQHVSVAGAARMRRVNCGCGNVNCGQRHRLGEWRPAQETLWSFLASAVKGPGPRSHAKTQRTQLQAKGLVTGTYFPLLCQQGVGDFGRLRAEPVELKVCSSPQCAGRQRVYEGDRCEVCRARFDPARTARRTDQRIILVGADVPIYERQARFHCSVDDNYFDAKQCPLCGTKPAHRRVTHVWVRTHAQELRFEDNPGLADRIAAGADDLSASRPPEDECDEAPGDGASRVGPLLQQTEMDDEI